MNKMNSRVMELTIISGESLSLAGNRPVKKNAYVVINTGTGTDRMATAMATDNGSYPLWSQMFLINMPMHATFFTLEVRSGDHVIGSARVPVSDFTSWYFPTNYLHFLSYRLRDKCGGRNGIINLSVKVKSPENFAGAGSSTGFSAPAAGWKYGGGTMGKGASEGVAIGVPFRY